MKRFLLGMLVCLLFSLSFAGIMMRIRSLSLLIVLLFCLSLVGVQEGWALEYFASPIDTFIYDYQPPSLNDYNSMAGSNRGFYKSTGGWSDPDGWNSMKFETTVDNSHVSFAVDQFTLLQNRWERDIDGQIEDFVYRQGTTTFQPFDSSLGTLNSVQMQYEWYLGSVLYLSLRDDGFFHNAEGEAGGWSSLHWAIGNVEPVEDYDMAIYNATYTGWHTGWAGFYGSILNNLNSGAYGGPPSVYDALTCFYDPESCTIELADFQDVWIAKAYGSVQEIVTLTPEEYLASMNGDQEFQISLQKFDYHRFSYEAGDTYDESGYYSFLRGNMGVLYGYTPNNNPVPEPSTILLLGGGLAGLAFYRRKRK